jgi:phosphatidylethanolamine-binding protein (PEBP) family uncharacterized protein
MQLSSQNFQNGSPIAGEFAFERIARGKNGLEVPDGLRQGVNDFTGWFLRTAPTRRATYFGYDGPRSPLEQLRRSPLHIYPLRGRRG